MKFKNFSLTVPSSWTEFNLWIEDSYVGGLKMDSGDEVIFDLGSYSNSLDDVDSLKHNFAWATINGRKAKLVTPKQPGQGTVAIYIDGLWVSGSFEDDSMAIVDKFVMGGQNLTLENEKLLVKAFGTLNFRRN